ncbi:helix-turn-helix domain-containing protein [Domibacillus sp. A3M-37]|uniref:helix-turn-helix domain-containing protein n=1 Tax=Domibacillus sp. A3M-37 TaxID=2962037 RepID=UPI0020B8917E|nr:helix-turn-helix domain-containing protein [Domibacillus sp. A3M-37]MCP3763690.1 helix-turn-helix domain-containing protein [Domibacillus sp. A3M-37]
MSNPEYYSTKEVAELIKRSVPTVHVYVQEGKLTPVEDPWSGHHGHLFSKEEVERFIEAMPEEPTGMSLNQAAARLHTNRASITTYINEGLLPSTTGKVLGRTATLIHESDLKEFSERYQKRIQEDRLTQRQYYNKKTKEAVYQRFSSPSLPEARLMREGLGEWYFIDPATKQTFSYNEGIYTHRLTPNYSVEFGKRTGTPGYAILKLPTEYSLTYQAMDLIYQHVKAANLYVELIGDRIVLHMKDTILRGVSEELGYFLKRQLVQGRIQYSREHEAISIESEEELLSVYLPRKIKEWLKKEAEEKGTSMQEVAGDIIEEVYNREQGENRDNTETFKAFN